MECHLFTLVHKLNEKENIHGTMEIMARFNIYPNFAAVEDSLPNFTSLLLCQPLFDCPDVQPLNAISPAVNTDSTIQ